jgi:hypothetical protein
MVQYREYYLLNTYSVKYPKKGVLDYSKRGKKGVFRDIS